MLSYKIRNNKFIDRRINLQYFIRLVIIAFAIHGFILITGCEGYRCGDGAVYDSKTKEPLDSVLCKVSKNDEIAYTDSIGKYNVCNPFGGCLLECSDIVIEFTKVGYKSRKVTNPNNSNIYLEKE